MTEVLNSATAANVCSGGKTAGLQIAVFVDQHQLPCTAFGAVRIALFHKRSGKWTEIESRRISPPHNQSTEAMYAFIDQIAALTTDAQAIAGSSIAGKLYAAFNKRGKHIFEIPEISPEQLSGIAEDVAMIEAKQVLSSDAFESACPVQTELDGVYTLDLVTALEGYPGLSSKMILKPFFKSTPFTELTLICRHLPHWLPQERNLEIQSKQREEYLVVTVQKKHCGEASE